MLSPVISVVNYEYKDVRFFFYPYKATNFILCSSDFDVQLPHRLLIGYSSLTHSDVFQKKYSQKLCFLFPFLFRLTFGIV